MHILTRSQQPWLELSGDAPVFADYYDRNLIWLPESLARFAVVTHEMGSMAP
jgi:hypothetical protein|tara:strand:+ start:238 stop:393 length:156 start_codon:yes stop_codon:yes gene_type:complete